MGNKLSFYRNENGEVTVESLSGTSDLREDTFVTTEKEERLCEAAAILAKDVAKRTLLVIALLFFLHLAR